MSGGMAGSTFVDDKENTPVGGDKKKERDTRSGGRRLSINGLESRAHYLKAIANRFKRKGGAGRGRILVHRPLRFDGSPFECDSRSGEKRRSFLVFEDDVDSVSSKPKECATGKLELGTAGKVLPTAMSKNATLGKCWTHIPRVSGEEAASMESVEPKPKYLALESVVAIRARAKAMFASESGQLPGVPLAEAANQQESGSRTPLQNRLRRWQLGGSGSVYSQCSLDTSELEDIEQLFRKMDDEDLEEEVHKQDLDRELHKYDHLDEMQEKVHREHEEVFVSAQVSEAHETVEVHVEERATVCELEPELFDSQDRGHPSPRIDGLQIEAEIANVELATPQLRLDLEVPAPNPSPVILELGVSPESSAADKAIEQLTPVGHFLGCKNQGLDSPQQIPEEVESQLEQTVNDVLFWSVELDPSRRRREIVEECRNWRSPWPERIAHSSFLSANLEPRSASDVRELAQLTMSLPLSSLKSCHRLDDSGSAKNLVGPYQIDFMSTTLPSSSGKDQSGQKEGVEVIDGGFSTCPDQATTTEDDVHIASLEIEREMKTWRDSKATLRNSWSSCPNQSPVRPVDLSTHCMGDIHERPSESSRESPSSQAAELLRRVESVTATPPFVQASLDTIGISPTPPRDLCLYLGNPFGGMSGEELSQRWLQFCTSPSVFSDVVAKSKKAWKVESTFMEATSLAPTTSFSSEQFLERTVEARVLPNSEEEAVSSDDLDWKTSTHDEGVLPNSAGEAVTCDGFDWKASTHDEDLLPNSAEEALSSDGSDGVMDYENDIDDISNDTTQIIQTGPSSADNDQEGTSALKECPQEVMPVGEDLLSLNLTPFKETNPGPAIIDPAVKLSLTHLEEEHIDLFMSSLQVTPFVDESRVERPTISGEDVSKVTLGGSSPAGKAGISSTKELITPGQYLNKAESHAQDECTPVQKQCKPKRSRKSTKTQKVDSPLDAGSKWSNGKRQSTRIRSKPLDWWRGERMLYGRVHSSLNTLIGIKHLSPDPVWPRPRTGDRKNKAAPQKFKVDSFVSDEHNELLRLAAQ